MRKFSGILKELTEQPPNSELTIFLEDKLQIPPDKAEVLAARIKKEFLQNENNQVEVRKLLEKMPEPEVTAKQTTHSVECLALKEFGVLIQWMLEELGYEVQGQTLADWGFDFITTHNAKRIAVLARKYPKDTAITEAIFLGAQQTQSAQGCNHTIIATPTQFTKTAISEAQKIDVELWSIDVLASKLVAAKQKANNTEQTCFPPYQVSLFQSLLALRDAKLFLVEQKSEDKYDIILPGVKYPLLSFEVEGQTVMRCVFRIKYNEPVPENDGEQLIAIDEKKGRTGPNETQAYEAIVQYLTQFLE